MCLCVRKKINKIHKIRASTSRFLPGGNVSNPQRSLNTSFIDSTDYHSLQASASFQPIGRDFNQPYASLNNFNQGYGYDTYGDLRCAKLLFFELFLLFCMLKLTKF